VSREAVLGRKMRKCHVFEGKEDDSKGEAIPITGSGGLQGSEMLRMSHCLDSWFRDGAEFSLTHWPRSTPQKHFLLLVVLISVRD
jgi:hypothetical protein